MNPSSIFARNSRWSRALIATALSVALFFCACPVQAADPSASFMVMSDPHYYDPVLGVEGEAFQAYLAKDRKMIAESDAIMRSFVEAAKTEAPDFLIVPGDLTKDGEKASHEKLAQYFAELEAAGIAVYVAPGNHDINNPHAYSYSAEGTAEVETVTPEEFESIYENYGYGEAIDRDPASLSYLAEPVEGLWLLSLDSCKYDDNTDKSETSGAFSQATLNWIVAKLAASSEQGKTVAAMMHHGLVEHFTGQSTVPGMGDEYVIDDWKQVSQTLSDAGLQLMFTGHYHGQDVTALYGTDAVCEKPVYDVMTGSLVTWPSTYRVVSILDNTFHIESRFIEEIDYDTQGISFQDYGLNFLSEGLVSQASALLQSQFGVPAEQADAVASLAASSLIAFYRGDETPNMQTLLTIGSLIANEETMVLGQLLGSLWTDLPPADNDLDLTIYDLDDASYPGLVYPHVAYSAAENQDTEINLVNYGTTEIQGKFLGYSEAGAAVYETETVTLAPGGSHGLTLSATSEAAESIAYMVFETEAKTTYLKGCSRIKTNGEYARAIEATDRIGNGPIPVVHTASTSAWMTSIGLVNASDVAKVAIINFDNGETKLQAIPARGKVYRSIRSFFDGEVQPAVGAAVVRNGKDLVAMCDYQSLGDSTYYAGAMLMKTCLSPVLYFPDMQLKGDRATGIAIHNSLDVPVQATATPYNATGDALDAINIEIPANGKYVGVAQNLGFPEDTAWFKLEADAGVAGMELTVSRDGKNMTGFSAPAAPGMQGVIPTMEDDGATIIIGLVNTGDSIADVYLTAYDKNGLIIASGVSSLAGYASTTVTMDAFLPAGSSSETLDDMDYVRYSSTAPVIVYQINRSEDQMMADGLVNVDPCEMTVTIAHMNDSHSHLESESLSLSIDGVTTYCTAGGFARITDKIESLRKTEDHLLFLHAGDLFQGTLYFTEFKGMADLELVEMMGLDAMCVGNHEFDLGPSVLADFIDQASFPVLSANADVSSEPLLAGKVQAYTTVSFGDETIGIIGLTTAETGIISSPGKNVTFADAATAAQNAADQLTEAGVNKIVVLSHLGYEQDMELAEAVTDVDVIVGGHSHTLLGYMDNIGLSTEGDYPTVVDNPEDEEVLVVQAWNHGLALGLLEVTFDCDGKVVSHAGSPVIPLDDVFLQKDADGNKVEVEEDVKKAIENVLAATPAAEIVDEDEAAAAALAAYAAQIEDMKQEVIGQAAEDLYHVRIPGSEHATAGVMENGSLIAPVVAQGMLEKAQAANLEPDMVLQNAGGVRVDILKGDITVAKVYELQPYGNTLVTVKLTGAQILEALEAGVEQALTGGSGAFPYTAGARFNVDLNKAEGERISQVQFKKDDGWTDLDENDSYVLVTNNFTASGGDGYTVLAEGEQYDTGYVDADIFMEYVQKHTPISALDEICVNPVSE